MSRNRLAVYLLLLLIMAIIGTLVSYVLKQEAQTAGIFPRKLGDMTLESYVEGEAAMEAVKRLHGGKPSVRLKNACIADYDSASGFEARFWVSESHSRQEAASLLAAMDARVGMTGMFSYSTPVEVEGLTVSFVSGLSPEMGLYHYFYAKDNRVYWVQMDNPDEGYRVDLVRDSIRRIGAPTSNPYGN